MTALVMKLWLIEPRVSSSCSGFVIRALDEISARAFASLYVSGEWQSDAYASCKELTTAGDAGVILYDFNRE